MPTSFMTIPTKLCQTFFFFFWIKSTFQRRLLVIQTTNQQQQQKQQQTAMGLFLIPFLFIRPETPVRVKSPLTVTTERQTA